MKNLLFLIIIALLGITGCSKPAIDPSTVTHSLRFHITASGGNQLRVFGRLYEKDSIHYVSSKIDLDTTFIVTLGRGDYCNLDILGQIPSPKDSVPLDYTVNAKAYIDNNLIKEETGKFGVGLDIYYANYIPY